jgi:diguanylate cyclase (GGDEF)-like protein/PAS domain S-box-containing protein
MSPPLCARKTRDGNMREKQTAECPAVIEDEQAKQLLDLQSAALKAAANAIVITDRDATIVWVNAAFEQLTGYSSDEVIGQNTRLLKAGQHPPSFYKNLWDTILAGNQWRGELVNRRKDGTIYWEEMAITPIRNRSGEIAHFIAIKQDITERKRSEEQLYMLAQAVKNSCEFIGVADPEGRITFSNRAFQQALGYSEDEMLGKHFNILLSARNPPGLNEEIGAQIYQGDGWKGECLIPRRDGTGMPVFLSTGQIKDAEGRLLGVFGIARDVTELKRAEQRIRQLAQVVETSSELIAIGDREGRVTYGNPTLLKATGYAEEEIIGQPFNRLLSSRNAPALIREMEEQTLLGSWRGECLQLRKDGTDFPVLLSKYALRDREGNFMGGVGISEDITERKQKEHALAEAHEQLNAALREAEGQAHDSAKLTELVDILQSCQTVEEAYSIAENVLPATLPSRSGALCITSASRNLVEAVSVWGGEIATEKAFGPDDCWALRRGKTHRVKDSASPLRCAHVKGPPPADGYLCVPLAAQGETLGVLYLEYASASAAPSSGATADPMAILERQATAVGERLSLALANLRLREALQRQSIRDPLTGLFNRRFMEESLEREMGRAARGNQPVALVMLDIDHFKRFNDSFGHQAGDTLLRALGNFLKQRTRGQDVACRYGGEEFAFILAGATLDAARQRAEILREELKLLQVQHAGQLLGTITLSIGIAAFPEHASNAETLLKAADDALYRAKKEGRDRIVVA